MRRMATQTATEPETTARAQESGVKQDQKMQVTALRNGTVIDHLGRGTAIRTLHLLALDQDTTVLTGVNLPSGKQGKKDLIKVEGRELTEEEINKVALLSANATLSIIRDYKVVRKIQPHIPDEIAALIRCVNPACVTQNHGVETHFRTESREPLKLRCTYCERSFPQEEIDFL